MLRELAIAVAVGFPLSLGGCVNVAPFRCASDAQCLSAEGQGTCELDVGQCSFADPACPQGRRYGTASDRLAGVCVGEEDDDDAGDDVGGNDGGGDDADDRYLLPDGDFEIAPDAFHTCMVLDRQVSCAGRNAEGEVGDGTFAPRDQPVVVEGLDVIAIDTGTEFSCALEAAGTVKCWGNGLVGQLGDAPDPVSESTQPLAVPGLAGVSHITLGNAFACGLEEDGVARCWGDNWFGQCGDGDFFELDTPPVTVLGLGSISAISAGFDHACAVSSDGLVWCWGDGADGQCGIGNSDVFVDPPGQVIGPAGVADVKSGRGGSCARNDGGEVWCWGRNQRGQLGTGSGVSHSLGAVPVLDLPNIAEIASGESHFCARDVDGKVWCWGDNAAGQLGGEAGATAPRPVLLSLPPVVSIAAGGATTCAVTADRELGCWGQRPFGSLAP